MLRFCPLLLLCAASFGSSVGSWNEQFVPPPGVVGDLNCMTEYDGSLVVGGRFIRASGVEATNIAKWNGTNWQQFGGGVNGITLCLATSGNDLYVGGAFDRAGEVEATNLVRWDGRQWQSLGSLSGYDFNFPIPPAVLAILPVSNGVYVAGSFREAAGVAATNVAFWNGTNWSAVGGGIGSEGGQVHTLAFFHGQLYAGGIFRDAGNKPCTNVARWNGTEWLPLGEGLSGGDGTVVLSGHIVNGAVYSLAMYRNKLCVGGNFFKAGKHKTTGLAFWNGHRWLAAGRGVSGEGQSVLTLHRSGSGLFVGGSFARLNGQSASNVTKWPSSPRSLRHAINASVNAIAQLGNDVYVGGQFGLADSVSAGAIARWDGKRWHALGEGVGNAPIGLPFTVSASDTNVFIAGGLRTVGTNRVNNAARWDGNSWHALGDGLPNGQFRCSVASGSNFYVGGSFEFPSIGATNLAQWNGVEWRAVGGALRTDFNTAGSVEALEFVDGKLYVGGLFASAGGVPATNLASWDGTNWLPFAPGLPDYVGGSSLGRLMVHDATNWYVVAGIRDELLSRTAAVWRWDGIEWSMIGKCGRYWEYLTGLGTFQGKLYAIGSFSKLGGVDAQNIAQWDGTTWAPVGDHPPMPTGSFMTLTATANALYLGGIFDSTTGISANGVVRWDGTDWLPLGTGLTEQSNAGYPFDSVSNGSSVFFVGFFDAADHKPSYHFAEWLE